MKFDKETLKEFCHNVCANRSGDECCCDYCTLAEYVDWIDEEWK